MVKDGRLKRGGTWLATLLAVIERETDVVGAIKQGMRTHIEIASKEEIKKIIAQADQAK